MKQFIIQTLGMIVLWGLFFYFEGEVVSPSVMLICAAIMTLYFFLKVASRPFYLYMVMTGLLLTIGFIERDILYILLLILYIAQLASEQLNLVYFRILVIISAVGLLVFALINIIEHSAFIYSLLFYILAIQLNSLSTKKREQRNLYEELLGEYRRLKRMSLVSEEEARNQERTKIARDIHDSVGHKLTALLMQLEILSIKNGAEPYLELKELAKDSLEETRFAVRALKDRESEGIATILMLIKKLEAESHIIVHFTTKQGILSARLTNEQSIVLYRFIQEGLTNAMRHAHARDVHVVLGKTANDNIEVTVKNRIYKKVPFEEGFGLQNMRKRVEELQGTLTVYQTDEHFIIKGMIPGSDEEAKMS
ncbi:sensor histidine kinase [Metabacillus malikii]|uniref:histidine kinase n=1 Tax=Metabacillus malikii TaxID=1504265 RepID=A0ABT9ZHN5_9BACI|nr:sensor histidine kinase [Metabacillus malikii]MDQ0231807.1 signal transduction histidine kinase [Metabacillus malikii]